jgi:hypothetical protein
VHFDNAVSYWSAVTEKCLQNCQFQHIFQSPYNPDISLYDSCRFGDLKMKLKGQ